MDNERQAFLIDIILSLSIIVFSIIIYINTLDLPPPKYEPMGAAALPRVLAVLLSIFSLFILIKAIVKRRRASPPEQIITPGEPNGGVSETFQQGYMKAAIVFTLTCIYVFVMSAKLTGFLLATIVYMFLAGTAMKRANLSGKVKMASFTIVFSVATFFIFTRFFYIDLP